MWGYYWGYTCAQLELMLVDQPLIVYPKDKKKRERPKGKNGMREFESPKAVKAAEAQLRWQQRYGNGQKVNVGQFHFGKKE